MANHIELPNNCRASHPCVFPSNWETCKVDGLEKKWYVTYRFYDDNLELSKMIMFRSFNTVHTLKERRERVTRCILKLREGLENGFNPFKASKKNQKNSSSSIAKVSEKMSFSDAILFAFTKETETRGGNKNPTHKFFVPVLLKIAQEINISDMPIEFVSQKHIKELLQKCGLKKDDTFSNDQFNRYRGMLRIFYRELKEYEIVSVNIPADIQKKKAGTHIMRETLSHEHLSEIDTHLLKVRPRFRIYLHCFFHSGARSSEILRLRISDIDFEGQRIKYLIKKGKQYKEMYRPLMDVAIDFWKQAISGYTSLDDYVFSDGLRPGKIPIRSYAITQWFYKIIKTATNADGSLRWPGVADFYSLKHLHVTSIINEIGIEAASMIFAELRTTIMRNYYIRTGRFDRDILSASKPLIQNK